MQAIEFIADGAAGAVEDSPPPAKSIGPVQDRHVQVGIQVQGRAEALDQGDRAGAGPLGTMYDSISGP